MGSNHNDGGTTGSAGQQDTNPGDLPVLLHVPVLLDEVLKNLITAEKGTYVDATFGRGGHSYAMLQKLASNGRVIAFDRDDEAVAEGRKATDPRLSVTHGRFGQLGQLLAARGVEVVDGVLMDIGVSSPQLDSPERGFSFSHDGPLDMRMDRTAGITASAWLAEASTAEIVAVLRQHGEEKFARPIARAIARQLPIKTTSELANIVANAVPAQVRYRKGKHPATQTFQAIRIHINGEDQELASGLQQGFDALKPGARLAVISFHSLEDRVVKHQFRSWSQPPPLPRRIPVRHASQKVAGHLIAGPIKASVAEVAANPRARSAVLRVVEKASG